MEQTFYESLSDPFGNLYLFMVDNDTVISKENEKEIRVDNFLQKENVNEYLNEFCFYNRMSDSVYLSAGTYYIPQNSILNAITTKITR